MKISTRELQIWEFTADTFNKDWEAEGILGNVVPRAAQTWIFPFQKQNKKHGKSRIRSCWIRDHGFLVNEGNSVSQHLEKFGGTEMSTEFVDNGMLNIPFGQEDTTNPTFIPSG